MMNPCAFFIQLVITVALLMTPSWTQGGGQRTAADDFQASNVSTHYLSVRGGNLTYRGEKVFLSGMNQAWVHYGCDFGGGNYKLSRTQLLRTLDAIQLAGGNSIRIWLHVDGSCSPEFDARGYVRALDRSFILELQDFLEQARRRNIFVIPVLWNCAVAPPERLLGLIWEDDKLQSYIDRALIPLVEALRAEPSLGLWEIMNEPEGCMQMATYSDQRCLDTSTIDLQDFADWTRSGIPLQRLLVFIGRQVDAIHAADAKALVTVGSWTYKSVTDALHRRNFYSDHCLSTVSQRPRAKLDLYTIHTYDILHAYAVDDPFKVNKSHYEIDTKPLILGEFSQARGGGMTSPQQFTWAYYHGYSGAWSWCALDGDDASDSIPVQQAGMRSVAGRNDQAAGGRVNVTIGDGPRFPESWKPLWKAVAVWIYKWYNYLILSFEALI